jgi:hypothetical protein
MWELLSRSADIIIVATLAVSVVSQYRKMAAAQREAEKYTKH